MYAEFSVDRAWLFRATRGQSIIYPRLNICHIQNALNQCPGEEHWREYAGVRGDVLLCKARGKHGRECTARLF
jgi:hypothetical protein